MMPGPEQPFFIAAGYKLLPNSSRYSATACAERATDTSHQP